MFFKSQSGRSMIEMLAVLAIIGMLSIIGIYGFKQASTSAQVNTTTKDMSNAITERRYQNAQGGSSKEHILNMKIGSTPMEIRNIMSGEDKGTFSVTLENQTKTAGEGIIGYSMFKPKKIVVNGQEIVVNGQEVIEKNQVAWKDANNKIQFFFNQTDSGLTAGGDGLSSPCDGVRCKTCERCDQGKCIVDKNKVGKTFGCGVCQSDGTLKKNESLNYTCSSCDESDWSLVPKPKKTRCGKCQECDGDGSCESTGTPCGTECCPNGCNNTGDACKKECTPVCDRCHTCNTDTGICEIKEPSKELCGATCCKSENCCNGQCCAEGQTCDGTQCVEYTCPVAYQELTCTEDQTLGDTQTLPNGKVCYKCDDITACPVDYTEGVCSAGLETLKTLTLKNGKTCVQCGCNNANSKVGDTCSEACGCTGGLTCSNGKCVAECSEQEYKYVLQGTGTICEHCPVAHKATCTTQCTETSSPAGCCFSEILDALDDCICAKTFTHSRKKKIGTFSGMKEGNYTVTVDNGMWHCGASYPSCTYSRGQGAKSCSCGTGLYIESNGVKTELTGPKTIYLKGDTYMYLEDGTVSSSVHNGDGCYDNCGQVALKFVKTGGCSGETTCSDIARIFDKNTCSCVCNSEIYKEVDGQCVCKDDVIIPQSGVFAGETPCYAKKEIARLGPYACDYDVYVKGHVDDTFLVTSNSGTSLCTNNKQHHMVDGILYTIPAGKSIIVYAQDRGCAIIAWERDYHGAENRTPVPATMELRKATHAAGWCNTNI